ncbi:lysylphosphatidylglycerol synthase domain-containing protein [Paenibacillus silvestris]|nr:lysylphosphatidylglycerol synthase domain-containing protein [Paenibacillus silvestris]
MLKILLVVVILYFANRSLALKPVDLVTYLMDADYRFYVSMVLFTVFLMLQASIWVLIVNAVGAKTGSDTKLDVLSGLLIFINSQFAKYIPGGFWNYAGRIVLATRAGVSLAAQFAAIVYENVLLVSAALSYALLLAFSLDVVSVPICLFIGAIAGTVFIYYSSITAWISRIFVQVSRWKLLVRLLQRMTNSAYLPPNKSSGAILSRNEFFGYFLCFLGSHFVMGIAFWMLSNSFGAGQIGIFYAAGTFATSWLLGLLSPLPGGLGVREGFLVYFLSHKLGTEAALHISIIARLWNMMAEITFWTFIQTANRLARKVRNYES